MTPEEQNRAIAEACGIHVYQAFDESYPVPVCKCGKMPREHQDEPDYLNDLNAMREAEKNLLRPHWTSYKRNLREVTLRDAEDGLDLDDRLICATAAQRAESFLRTIGKWPAPTASERISAGKGV